MWVFHTNCSGSKKSFPPSNAGNTNHFLLLDLLDNVPRAHTNGGVQQYTLLRKVLRRVLEIAFEKVLRRVLRRCLAVAFIKITRALNLESKNICEFNSVFDYTCTFHCFWNLLGVIRKCWVTLTLWRLHLHS